MATPIEHQLRQRAAALGFDRLDIASARAPAIWGDRLDAAIANGWHASMDWLPRTAQRRRSPQAMWPAANSVIVLAMNYGPGLDPLARLEARSTGVISVYALNRDYHDIVKGRLKQLAQWFASRTGEGVKVFVDTAPLMEKPLAQAAGIGWQGKHSNLVSRDFGSWLFLGAILTTARLRESQPETDHCGACRACLDICPTGAFPAPYQLDARRCISYLTIEHKGHISRQIRPLIGNRIYGCDDCLAVCPWNKFARIASQAGLAARAELVAPHLADLAQLTDAAFRKLFAGSPVKRIGRDRFVRNVLIAIGNSGDPALADVVRGKLADDSALVRAMAVWALSRLVAGSLFSALRDQYEPGETDTAVRAEWNEVQ